MTARPVRQVRRVGPVRLVGLVGLVLLQACRTPSPQPVAIAFVAEHATQPFRCTPFADGLEFHDLRLFVHGVELLDAAGKATPVALDADGSWQDGKVALLDFEDATGACDDGSTPTRTIVRGAVPPGSYSGLRFVLGVPFELNHADPGIAEAPLNLGRLHWGWRAGYKFLRLEAKAADGKSLQLHWGSADCEGTVGAIESCAHPNRAVIEVPQFDAGRDVVRLDLDAILATLNAPGGDAICMGEPGDADCADVAIDLGLTSDEPRRAWFTRGMAGAAEPR